MIKNYFSKALLVFFFTLFVVKANAAFEEVKALEFGAIVVLNKGTNIGSVNLDYLGNFSYSGNIYGITDPSVGIFSLNGYQSNTTIYISGNSVQATTNSTIPSPNQFILSSINVPNSVVTDNNGNARINVGGILETTGSNSDGYSSTNFSIRYQITINY